MKENPETIVVAGPNGAGKTTFIDEYLQHHDILYLAADRIAAEIHPESPESVGIAAGREFLNRIRQSISNREPFLVETTLSGKTFRKFYQQMEKQNYLITTYFLYLNSPEQHVQRVKQRTERGGHHVSDDDVRRRYKRSIKNFWNIYRYLSDYWFLVNNSGNSFVEVALGEQEYYNLLEESYFQELKEIIET